MNCPNNSKRKLSLHQLRKRSRIGSEELWPLHGSPLPQGYDLKVLICVWRLTGSIRLQDLAVGSIFIFSSTLSGDKLVSILNRVGMKLTGKRCNMHQCSCNDYYVADLDNTAPAVEALQWPLQPALA
eukprot:1144281-Pelagomonas_calceolata.AAC.1